MINLQRVGPSTGMPTRTQQADIIECAYASHGDTRRILISPANPTECFVTGLLYIDESVPDIHELNETPDTALIKVPYEKLRPGSVALGKLQEDDR